MRQSCVHVCALLAGYLLAASSAQKLNSYVERVRSGRSQQEAIASLWTLFVLGHIAHAVRGACGVAADVKA